MKSEDIYTPNDNLYPPSLTALDYWSVMKLAWSDSKNKFSKTPIDLRTGLPANSDEMSVSFPFASDHLTQNTVLSCRYPDNSTPHLGFIDCDHCVAPNGTISSRVRALLSYMDTYAEYSITDGIHLLCWLDVVPPGGHKDREWDMEFYWRSRSIPITGDRVRLINWESPSDLQPRTSQFLKLHKSRFRQAWLPPAAVQTARTCVLSRDEILSKIQREGAGKKWMDLYAGNWQGHYKSPSDADLALLMKFAFYSSKDPQMMESMFSECALSKISARGTLDDPTVWRTPKWENANYRQKTLDTAIANTTSVYTPRPMSAQEEYKMMRQRIDETRKQK